MQGILKTDTCHAHRDLTIDTSKMVSFAPTTKPPIQTAPSGRRRNSRSHVRNLFQVYIFVFFQHFSFSFFIISSSNLYYSQ